MEPDTVEADDDLQNMPASVMEGIIHGLNQNDAWLTMAKNLKDGRGKKAISDASLSQMKKTSSPGRQLIDMLMRNLLRVRDFQAMLEGCQLYDILKLINTSEPAKIMIPERDACYRVKLGSPKVEFFVEVCGSPYPDIQWYFNGKPLIGKTSPELSLENFSLKDVGEYTCKVKQRLHGAVSELTSPKYIFTPDDSPSRILKDLEDVEIKANDDLTLSFEVTGYPEPRCFLWFKNNMFISRTEIPQLRRGKADSHSSGEYHCQVANRAGRCTTRRALVKIKEVSMCSEKPEIIKQPRMNQGYYYVGDKICLSCEVLCSKPVEFACFLNKDMLAKNSHIHDITMCVSRDRHKFDLKYLLTKEQLDKENWKPLVFRFEVSSSGGRTLADDVHVKVKKRDVKESYFARNKWALLIGNSNYPKRVNLPAAKCDLKIIWKNFVELGFRVLMLTDLKRTEIQNAVRLFSTFLQKGDYVSFCYAGHGLHNDGKDYIIPLDASEKLISKTQNAYTENIVTVPIDECISYVWIFNILQESEPALIFSIYDTCRPMTPKYDGCQPLASQDAYQTALNNSFTIFGTSEDYAAYEDDEVNTSLLMGTLQALMTRKIPVKELANQVLESFYLPSDSIPEGEKPQVPKIGGDLAKPLSLTDPSRPEEIDTSEKGVCMKWESLGGLGGSIQDSIALIDTNIKVSACWKAESPRDGVAWVISNCLELGITLSREGHQGQQRVDVQIRLSNRKMASGKMGTEFYANFIIPHLQAFEECLAIELLLTYRGQLYKKRLYLESPAISQKFYRGNYI